MSERAASAEQMQWSRALRGDGEAFAGVFDLHKDRVFQHAVYQLAFRSQAETATAGTFVELWRSRRQVVVVEGSVLPWLLGATTNVARNIERTRRRHRALLARLPKPAVDDSGDILPRMQIHRGIACLGVPLSEFSRVDATVLSLTHLEGYPIETAATVLGITVNHARTRLDHAQARLRSYYPMLAWEQQP